MRHRAVGARTRDVRNPDNARAVRGPRLEQYGTFASKRVTGG